MTVYTYSEARQRFADVLDQAKSAGRVLIKRRDGSVFSLTPVRSEKSPLDVPSIKAEISTRDLVALVRRARGRTRNRKRRITG